MSLGAFSISLSVKDLKASIAFYETLGFQQFHDMSEHGFAILKNGSAVIGLFQGMFEGNILTLNPGWDQNAQPVEDFEDVRDLQKRLHEAGIALETTADPDSTGPASFMLKDPDGNAILFDQHVDRPD
ncbi:VOC family protein [Cognatishimia maritima]|uniref:Glyoxalase-like domain-containing protein n=1 Tax=Cognatishimia maritima TaxID=870908 RepID=A0A1M5IQF7_9RHOB|nr:VOC family protein [Cognatishimia maritima]SHG30200.1 Glyoxalase-like domain-containing protein [Cognatishimia maritima]